MSLNVDIDIIISEKCFECRERERESGRYCVISDQIYWYGVSRERERDFERKKCAGKSV